MSRKAKSKNNIVKLTLDLANPPPLTIEQKNRLSALSALSDDQIDTSDAPHLPDAVWMKPADLPHTAWDAFLPLTVAFHLIFYPRMSVHKDSTATCWMTYRLSKSINQITTSKRRRQLLH